MTAPDGFEAAYATAGHDLHSHVHWALQAAAHADPERVGRAVAVDLVGRGADLLWACLAGRAVAELASARAAIVEMRRHPLDLPGRRYLTREVVADCAEEADAKRREDV